MSTAKGHHPGSDVTRVAGTGGVAEKKLCIGAAGNLVIAAAAGAVRVVGVPLFTALVGEQVTVSRQQILEVTYSAAAVYGDPLVVTTADGQVGPAGATPDARTIVGKCEQDMAGAGVGMAFIY